MPTRSRSVLCALVAVLSLVAAPSAAADLADETALAERYAPVVRLVEQAQDCGYGESYEPIDVDALFDEPTVSLRGPWNPTDLIEIGPTADDLPGLYEYHLDFPGNALDPGCDYERWAMRVTEGSAPTVYAHVATDPAHPGQLALQYWFYYVFNDWNNTHEGDWENIQLVFDADDARQALAREPVSVGYSQHEGSEEATWGDDKLELVDGTHPVVYPAAGSHANFFESALFLGSSAEQGVGCDDTSGPSVEVRPVVRTIPSDPAEARTLFPWIAFEGRWGELQRAFFNGPTGPNLKTSWTAADHGVGGLARSELRRPGRWRSRDPDHRLLLQCDRRRLERPAATRGRSASDPAGPRSAARARSLRALTRDVAADGAAPPGTPARVGPDPHGRVAHVRQTPLVVPRHRPRAVADLARRDAPAGDRHSCCRASRGSRPTARVVGCSCSSSS